ncbi:MAG: 30S ribosome-binding factor RbfA [Acidiferrobacter sp.]
MRTRHRTTGGSRKSRVGSLIRREVAVLMQTALGDPRIVGATLTGVDISPDLKQARIHVTHYRGEAVAREAVVGLNSASPRLRRLLAGKVVLRVVPNLVFAYDPSVDEGFRIDALIRRARSEDESAGNDP